MPESHTFRPLLSTLTNLQLRNNTYFRPPHIVETKGNGVMPQSFNYDTTPLLILLEKYGLVNSNFTVPFQEPIIGIVEVDTYCGRTHAAISSVYLLSKI